ncbi:MAG TPA: hypothetical protein VHZ49_08370 [Methylomirabilota bacterium]|jgi:hypothetical protein|nr:hypothetical protein [Methylomirabilota bacterium]
MELSDELVRLLVTERLTQARAEARRRALVPRGAPLRVRVGVALIALGQRLVHEVRSPQRVTS